MPRQQKVREGAEFGFKLSAILIGVAFLLYALGITWPLILLLGSLLAIYLPMPQLFSSVMSRLVMAFLLSFGLVQIAATLQLTFWPSSQFLVLAAGAVLLHVGLLLVVPKRVPSQKLPPLFSQNDLLAGLVVLVFLLPFAPIAIGSNAIARIAEVGGLQSIDATNHFAAIAELSREQHLTYTNEYYPKGFHIAAAFMQEAFIGQQGDLPWRTSAVVFFAQYVVMGSLMLYLVYYLALGFMTRLYKPQLKLRLRVLLALCLAPILVLSYALPFVSQGFLNYFYVCLTIIAGLIFLLDLPEAAAKDQKWLLNSALARWPVLAFLLLSFGASASWPLLAPPLLVTAALLLFSERLQPKVIWRQLSSAQAVPIVVAALLLLVPVYFQIRYATTGAEDTLHLAGGLKSFHGFVPLLLVAVFIVVVTSPRLAEATRRLILAIGGPWLVLLMALVGLQYFRVGDIRYYTIKTSLLVEILLMALALALFVAVIAKSKLTANKYFLFWPLVPLMVMLLLMTGMHDPLKDTRDVLRRASHQDTPAFYAQDVSLIAKLGSQKKVSQFNVIVLHYEAEKDRFTGHMQLPFWAGMLRYDASRDAFLALHCVGALHHNLSFLAHTAESQQHLIAKIEACAQQARQKGLAFYIVTDRASVPKIRQTFPGVVAVWK